MIQRIACILLAAWLAGTSPSFGQATRGRTVDIAAYIQPQYERTDTSSEQARDRTFFRRLVVSLEGQPSDTWRGVLQFDLGPVASGERLVIKDAYLQYVGWRDRGITLTIGNQKPPFSRSLLTSSSRRHTVERPFTGDRSLGSPGRALGIRVDGWAAARRVRWDAEVASSLHSPDADQVRVDGLPEAGSDWNEGILVAGRLEFHPRGEVAREQGAFGAGRFRYVLGLATYAWSNDDDRNLHMVDGRSTSARHADASSVRAFEASAALRGDRLSIDAEFERVVSRAIDTRFSGGLYRDGRALITKASIEAGYMLLARTFEVVGVADAADAASYDRPWRRFAAGANWYLDGHNLKIQVLQRVARHVRGSAGISGSATYLQAQVAF